jgi:hypothetical protein
MKLRPSEAMLLLPDGSVPRPVRLWEDQGGDLVWVKRGIKGDGPPASVVTGTVPCKWVDHPDPGDLYASLDMTGGCPKDGWVDTDGWLRSSSEGEVPGRLTGRKRSRR